MSQINTAKSSSFTAPPDGLKGFGFDLDGNPCEVLENGSFVFLARKSDITTNPANIIANKGVGLAENIPTTDLYLGDVYVGSDNGIVYTYVDAVTWTSTALTSLQFVTDSSGSTLVLYQFNGSILLQSTNSLDFVSVAPSAITATQGDTITIVLQSNTIFEVATTYFSLKMNSKSTRVEIEIDKQGEVIGDDQ